MRLPVLRTCKLYIGGKFPRSESGRSYPLMHPADPSAPPLAHISQASRKDIRNAVSAAHSAQPAWAAATPYLRSQILYRAAEMLETRAPQLAHELHLQDAATDLPAALAHVHLALDTLLHYAGWCDKFHHTPGAATVNPVSSPHLSYSVPVPVGVVAILPPPGGGLLGLLATLAPVLAGGNTALLLAPDRLPLTAVSLAECLHLSDLPPGVANLLTGLRSELLPALAAHDHIHSILHHPGDLPPALAHEELQLLDTASAQALRRVIPWPPLPLPPGELGHPAHILAFQETKTTWHPVAW